MLDEQKNQSETNQETLEVDVEALFNKARTGHHAWRQRGVWLVCTSCMTQHASFLGVDQELVGIDQDGKPILKQKAK